MGGITTEDVAKLVDNGNRRFALTPRTVLYFAREGRFFDMTPAIISDKSKANLLGKGLVCVQVIWFFIQWVTRVAAQYPLALIEIHAVVHVVCALSMYILWWKASLEITWHENCALAYHVVKETARYLRAGGPRYVRLFGFFGPNDDNIGCWVPI